MSRMAQFLLVSLVIPNLITGQLMRQVQHRLRSILFCMSVLMTYNASSHMAVEMIP